MWFKDTQNSSWKWFSVVSASLLFLLISPNFLPVLLGIPKQLTNIQFRLFTCSLRHAKTVYPCVSICSPCLLCYVVFIGLYLEEIEPFYGKIKSEVVIFHLWCSYYTKGKKSFSILRSTDGNFPWLTCCAKCISWGYVLFLSQARQNEKGWRRAGGCI